MSGLIPPLELWLAVPGFSHPTTDLAQLRSGLFWPVVLAPSGLSFSGNFAVALQPVF